MNNLPTLHEIKMKIINERLEMFDGNRSQAARSLGIHPASIANWIGWFDELAHWRGKAKPGNPKLRRKSAI